MNEVENQRNIIQNMDWVIKAKEINNKRISNKNITNINNTKTITNINDTKTIINSKNIYKTKSIIVNKKEFNNLVNKMMNGDKNAEIELEKLLN